MYNVDMLCKLPQTHCYFCCFSVKLENNSETLSLERLLALFYYFLLATFSLHPSEFMPRTLTKASQFHSRTERL